MICFGSQNDGALIIEPVFFKIELSYRFFEGIKDFQKIRKIIATSQEVYFQVRCGSTNCATPCQNVEMAWPSPLRANFWYQRICSYIDDQ